MLPRPILQAAHCTFRAVFALKTRRREESVAWGLKAVRAFGADEDTVLDIGVLDVAVHALEVLRRQGVVEEVAPLQALLLRQAQSWPVAVYLLAKEASRPDFLLPGPPLELPIPCKKLFRVAQLQGVSVRGHKLTCAKFEAPASADSIKSVPCTCGGTGSGASGPVSSSDAGWSPGAASTASSTGVASLGDLDTEELLGEYEELLTPVPSASAAAAAASERCVRAAAAAAAAATAAACGPSDFCCNGVVCAVVWRTIGARLTWTSRRWTCGRSSS